MQNGCTFSKAKNPGKVGVRKFQERTLVCPMGDGAHSIRHSFITRMRQLDVHEYWIDRLTGHARKTETARYGSFDLTFFE